METINITSAQYYNHVDTSVQSGIKATIDGTEMFVPLDPANTDYQAILEWVEDGNTIEDAD